MALTFRDRVAQWWVYSLLYPIFDKTFIEDSYACRRGKGQKAAADRLQDMIKQTEVLGGKWYYLKLDIAKYFYRIYHDKLMEILERKIKDPDMLELLTHYRIQPGTLILEVTESRRIDDPHAAVAILRPLRNAGVRVALDDFGMGYAGLRQLQHMKSLPIDVLKIDKMFVEGLPEDSSMIAAIIMLAQSLNLQMIAEGVETEAQRDWLAKAGVGIAQGFLFARPLPIEIFEESYLEEK